MKAKKYRAGKLYRYSWWLFDKEEDFLYCQILNRHPKSQPNVSFSPNITVSHPKKGKVKFDLNSLFRTQPKSLSGSKLTKRGVEFSDLERYHDRKDILTELENGKILGLCAANTIEGMSKKEMLHMNPNELYWKWDFWSKEKVEDEFIIIELRVINVTKISAGECKNAKGINNAEVRLYHGEKISNSSYNITKRTDLVTYTHPHPEYGDGYACFILSKEEYSNKKLLFGAQKKKKYKIAYYPVNINHRSDSEIEGFNPDQPCGNPRDVVYTNNESHIKDIRIPLIEKRRFDDKYPLIEFVTNKKVEQYVPANNKEKKANYHFQTIDKKKHVLNYKPQSISVYVAVYNLTKNKWVDVPNEYNKWILKLKNKEYRDKKFNQIVDEVFKLNQLNKKNLHVHTNNGSNNYTDAKKNLIRKFFEAEFEKNDKNKFLVTAILYDVERYKEDQDRFVNELNMIPKTVGDKKLFKNYAQKNPGKVIIYDFDTLIVDYSDIEEGSKKKKKKSKKTKGKAKDINDIIKDAENLLKDDEKMGDVKSFHWNTKEIKNKFKYFQNNKDPLIKFFETAKNKLDSEKGKRVCSIMAAFFNRLDGVDIKKKPERIKFYKDLEDKNFTEYLNDLLRTKDNTIGPKHIYKAISYIKNKLDELTTE